MIDVLPKSSYFGTLEIVTVYEYYDGPRLFSAVNKVGSYYIAFWIDSNDLSDEWLYAPISHERLRNLEAGCIKLRDIFTYPDDLLFRVTTYFENSFHSSLQVLPLTDLTDDILPPSDFYIDVAAEHSKTICSISQESFLVSELYIKRASGRDNPNIRTVGKVSDAFGGLYKAVLSSLSFKDKALTPIDARPGSFILRLKAPHIKECLPRVIEVFQALDSDDPYSKLIEMCVDTGTVEEFLEEVIDGDVIIKFGLEDNYEAELNISQDKAIKALALIKDSSSSYVSSLYVPQANDLTKVFKVVCLKANGEFITPEKLGLTTDRQVIYYMHAARMLGLLSNNNSINSAGFQFSALNESEKMLTASVYFESSRCGWAWLKWSGKTKLEQLDPHTAADFLIDMCPSLSESTAVRRAKTLAKWQQDMVGVRRT